MKSTVLASLFGVSMMGMAMGQMPVMAQSNPSVTALPKGVHVVETYTSHLVWKKGKEIGYVWLTNPNQGALETWADYTSNDKSKSVLYTYLYCPKQYPDVKIKGTPYYDCKEPVNANDSVSFNTSPAVADYYQFTVALGQYLAYSNTVYNIKAQTTPTPVYNEAEFLVPQFGVRNGESVERLSNGGYLYPNGKIYHFNQFKEIPKNEVPSLIVQYYDNYYKITRGLKPYYWFRALTGKNNSSLGKYEYVGVY